MDEDRSATIGLQRSEEKSGDLVIRLLRATADLSSCVDFQRRIWGESFADAVPATLLQISQKVGGITAGAFLGRGTHLVGFVYGMTGVRGGRLCHWSHMLGVLPEQRGQGIGQRLKHFQRRRVREMGVEEMLWSFDPLMAGNAHFNLNLLGVEIHSFEPEMYGDTGSALHAFGTDRFVARWDLSRGDEGGDGKRRTDGRVDQAVVRKLPLVNVLPGTTGSDPQAIGDATPRRLRLEIPQDIFKIQQQDPALALAWRQSTRIAFKESIEAGYRVAGFTRLNGTGRCAYILEREERSTVHAGV